MPYEFEHTANCICQRHRDARLNARWERGDTRRFIWWDVGPEEVTPEIEPAIIANDDPDELESEDGEIEDVASEPATVQSLVQELAQQVG